MFNLTANDSLQRRQSDPTRYAVDGGRIFSANSLQSQMIGDGTRRHSGNPVIQNPGAGRIFMNPAIPSVSHSIPVQANPNQSTVQRNVASTSTAGPDHRYIASAPAMQQQFQLPEQQRRPASYLPAPEPSQPQHVRQLQLVLPPNWQHTTPPQGLSFGPSVMQQRSMVSGSNTQGHAVPSQQMVRQSAPAPVKAPSRAPSTSISNHPAASSTSTREPASRLLRTTVPEAEAALLPVRIALEGLWGSISSAHTSALAKERDAHIASVKALNEERETNTQLRAYLSQARMKMQHDLHLAAKGDPSMSEETMRRLQSAVDTAREEGRNEGRREGRQELNALQLDFEAVQAELNEQKILLARFKAERENLRSALRASNRLAGQRDSEVLKLMLEIPPTREESVLPQSTEDKARMHTLLRDVDIMQHKLSELRQAKQKVMDFVQVVNMDLLALVDNWTRRGSDVLLSSRWKKVWTTAAINGQSSLRSVRRRPSVPVPSSTAATPILSRQDSIARGRSVSISSSPSAPSSISRKISVASPATSISTPISATVPLDTHETPIDVDLNDGYGQLPSSILAPPAKPPSSTTKYLGLLDVIAEARQNFGLPQRSENPAAGTHSSNTDRLASTRATHDYRSAYGLMALPPTPRDFHDPDPNDPNYDAHSVPRLSPPVEDQELPLWEERGWRTRTPPPASVPTSPATPARALSAHVPSSPCLLKDVVPLKRVQKVEAGSTSSITVDRVAPLRLGTVGMPSVIDAHDASVGTTTSGKRTRAEFEEGQGIQESDSRDGSIETERKRRPPVRPSLPPLLIKSEPMDAVFDQTAALSLDGTPAPEDTNEMNELEDDAGSADTTEVALKQEMIDHSETVLVHDSRQSTLTPVPVAERTPPVSNSTIQTTTIIDIEEGEITPDTSDQQTHPAPVPATPATASPTTSLFRKTRPIPDMVRRTRPSDHPPPPTTISVPLRHQTFSRPPKSAPTKLGISHIDLLYRTSGLDLVCRMCETRPRDAEKKTLTVARFPENSAWDTLIGHCRREHPVACEELEKKKPSDIAEMKQRLPGSRFGRS